MMYNDYQRERNQKTSGELVSLVEYRKAKLVEALRNAQDALASAAPNIEIDVAAQVIDLATRPTAATGPVEESYNPFISVNDSNAGTVSMEDEARKKIKQLYQNYPVAYINEELSDAA